MIPNGLQPFCYRHGSDVDQVHECCKGVDYCNKDFQPVFQSVSLSARFVHTCPSCYFWLSSNVTIGHPVLTVHGFHLHENTFCLVSLHRLPEEPRSQISFCSFHNLSFEFAHVTFLCVYLVQELNSVLDLFFTPSLILPHSFRSITFVSKCCFSFAYGFAAKNPFCSVKFDYDLSILDSFFLVLLHTFLSIFLSVESLVSVKRRNAQTSLES